MTDLTSVDSLAVYGLSTGIPIVTGSVRGNFLRFLAGVTALRAFKRFFTGCRAGLRLADGCNVGVLMYGFANYGCSASVTLTSVGKNEGAVTVSNFNGFYAGNIVVKSVACHFIVGVAAITFEDLRCRRRAGCFAG